MRFRGIGTAVIAALVMLGMIWQVTGCGLPSDAAASVNGVIITKDDVSKEISNMRKTRGALVPAEDAGDDYSNFVRSTTEKLVFYELVKQEADKAGITVTASEVQERLQLLADDSYLGELDKLKEDFAAKGFSEEDMFTEIARAIRQEKLGESVGKDIQVTDEDAQAYYDRNIIQYDQPERRQVRQIVTENEAAAQDAVRRARAGESFITLVEQLSVDPNAAQKKGAVGLVVKGQLPAELEGPVFSMQAGQVSDPIKSGDKWYVLSLENIMPANLRTFDQVREEIKEIYGAQQYSERWKTYGDDVRASASIEYAPDYDPALKTQT